MTKKEIIELLIEEVRQQERLWSEALERNDEEISNEKYGAFAELNYILEKIGVEW